MTQYIMIYEEDDILRSIILCELDMYQYCLIKRLITEYNNLIKPKRYPHISIRDTRDPLNYNEVKKYIQCSIDNEIENISNHL